MGVLSASRISLSQNKNRLWLSALCSCLFPSIGPQVLKLLRKHRCNEPHPHRGMKCAGTPQKVPDGMGELEWGSAPRGRQDHSWLTGRRGLDREDREEGKGTAGSEDDTVTGREVKDLARDRANLEAWGGLWGPGKGSYSLNRPCLARCSPLSDLGGGDPSLAVSVVAASSWHWVCGNPAGQPAALPGQGSLQGSLPCPPQGPEPETHTQELGMP